jgi:hypothetical protein
MCDETFAKLSEEAMRLARTHKVVTTKKPKVANIGEQVKDLKKQIDSVTSNRRVASQR